MTPDAPGGTTSPPGLSMPAVHLIDPDLGFLPINFTAKPDDAEPDAVLDVYHAADTFLLVKRLYLKELEDAGRQAEVSESELFRRWGRAAFRDHPGVDPDKLSVGHLRQAAVLCFQMVNDLKKGEPGSSTPA